MPFCKTTLKNSNARKGQSERNLTGTSSKTKAIGTLQKSDFDSRMSVQRRNEEEEEEEDASMWDQ